MCLTQNSLGPFPTHIETVLWQFSVLTVLYGLLAVGHSSPLGVFLEWAAPPWVEERLEQFDSSIRALYTVMVTVHFPYDEPVINEKQITVPAHPLSSGTESWFLFTLDAQMG
ncbi:hypothetical protein EDD18DRAFT_1115918 [Armillaria luteobubalina]|uniref:Uncharacterized protein n=1 Tax=Armillaria luteobubalina TaxID=153913 RepID=A0AA39P182_9AGAR|nr:hypothetical protein EDD18DRAFT_1115918 [Armillaria luteobubalina]